MANKRTPDIRFEGITEDWEQRRLSEVADLMDGDRGKNYPSGDDFSDQGHTIFLSAVNVTKNGFSFESDQYITEEKSNALGNGKLELNDIVLTSRGSIGHIAWYNNDIKSLVPFARINSGMLILRSKEDVEPSYIAQYLKSPLGKRQIDLISFGSAQPQLTKKDVSNYKISIPEKTEQAKLGEFFDDLDHLITLHQQELAILKQTKQGFLQKMFPREGEFAPEVRFPGFTDAWEQRELGSSVKFINGRAYKQKELLDKGKYRVLRVGNFNTNDRWYYSDLELEDNKYANTGDLLYLWATSFGPEIWNQERVIFHYHIWKLEIQDENIDKQYLYTWLETDKERIKQTTNGTTMVHVTKGSIEERGFQFPANIVEQQKIGSFFKELDNLIALYQRELEVLQETKIAFLQKMFV
ncbi:restriction endonuclease subunit S [Solibacillus sp. FSL H8-0523]|uniref:restriction endonuclease subunit S n=1 Tax=Solibacillus sp. FSL H8-0523 TaxID=2954511 RepID=UPI003101A05D